MNQLQIRAVHAHNSHMHLAHDNDRLRAALHLIADMAERSTSALAMPDIARIARNALTAANPPNPAIQFPKEDQP